MNFSETDAILMRRLPSKSFTTMKLEINQWKTCFSALVDDRNRMVNVSFQHAPPDYGFVNYIVSINNDLSYRNVRKKKTVATSVNFTDIEDGRYNIIVYPQECKSCIRPKSKAFSIGNGKNYLLNVTACGDRKENFIISPQIENTSKPMTYYLYLLFIPLLFFILALGIYVWKRYQVKAEDTYDINTSSTNYSASLTGKVKIFVLYAEDHSFHTIACKSFIHYLNEHCFCDVLNTSPKYTSIPSYEMEKYADFVLVINSRAFYHEFRSWKNKETCPFMESYFYPETFEKILENIKQSPAPGSCKYLMCSMDYVNEKCLPSEFSRCKLFKIVDDMTSLVCRIWNLDPRSVNANDVPRISEHIHSSPDGESLICAIENAEYFEKKHPNWFPENYKPRKENLPLLHRNDSWQSIV